MVNANNSEQEGKYDILQNAAGEILIIIRAVRKIRALFMTEVQAPCSIAVVKALLCWIILTKRPACR